MKSIGGILTTCFSGLLMLQLLGSAQPAPPEASCRLLSRPSGHVVRVLMVSEFYSKVASAENTAIICENIANSSDVDYAQGLLREFSHFGKRLSILFEKCNLDLLPANFLSSLQVSHLAFYECNMSAIPYGLINSKNDTLRLLWIIKSPVQSRTISSGGFQYNPKMKEVWFVDTGIKNLEEDAFRGFSNVIQLALSNNKIQILNNSTIEYLTKLEKLYINNNEIGNLDENMFRNLSNLEILDISGNKLTQLSEGILYPLKRLKILYLEGNNLHCDCDLQWLQDWLRVSVYKPVMRRDHPSCTTPMQGDLKTLQFCYRDRPAQPRDSSINRARPSLMDDEPCLKHVVSFLFIILCNFKMMFL